MHKIALALILATALGSAPVMAATTTTSSSMMSSSSMASTTAPKTVAPATSTVTGKVASVDTKACTVTLDNKTTYHFAAKCKISSLKVGETVTITYKVKSKIDWVTKIVVVKA